MWFYVTGRYVRFSISEFCLVTGLRYHGECDTQMYDSRTSKLKGKYFSHVDIVTHEDIKSTFFSACQMLDLDLVEALPDDDVARMLRNPSEMEMAMPYMNNVQYKKPIQLDLSSESRRKKRTKKSIDNASTSGKSVILLTDSSMEQPNVLNDDDNFVDPLPRRQESPP
ncbi:Hypothetical predicted protein [Olea europaea subsp. europaea]|uniref:Uncharacterized protein n=1 Tax=Olea europaea subsp. europaea TaxID=158383 RepID=A0A8S0SVI5_OLEEU|nr:Hypothetical predicted protein [Olea europaea subsp. europaea]